MKCRVLKPDYFDKFKCINSECEDCCCEGGWNITIEKNMYKKYMKFKNKELREKFKKNIIRNKKLNNDLMYAKFILDEGKCSFLTNDKLCGIYIDLGEKYMCNICKEYPRIYSLVNSFIQKSLTLSCIEAARIILLNKNIMEFNLEIEDVNPHELNLIYKINSEKSMSFIEKNFEELRSFSIYLLQYRDISIEDRLVILGLFLDKVEKNKHEKNIVYDNINLFKEYIEKGYYDNITEKINTEKNNNIQFLFIYNLVNDIIGKKLIEDKRYSSILNEMIKGLELEKLDIFNSKQIFENSYNTYYKNFIKEREYIYENYLVNYIFTYLFPSNADSLQESYTLLISNFLMIKFTTVALCSNYEQGMNDYKLVDIIQTYNKVMIHEIGLNDRIKKYLKDNKQNTIKHMILMIGK